MIAIRNSNDGSIFVRLDEKNTQDACKRAIDFEKFKKWNNNKYTKGIINSAKDPHKAARIGNMGEQAFHLVTGLPLDRAIREHGNRKDFIIDIENRHINIEVKTQQKEHEDGKFANLYWIKAKGKNDKNYRKLNADFYVFCLLHSLDKKKDDAKWAYVELVGWITKKDFDANKTIGPAVSSLSNHLNYYIHRKFFLNMDDFIIKCDKYLKNPRILVY